MKVAMHGISVHGSWLMPHESSLIKGPVWMFCPLTLLTAMDDFQSNLNIPLHSLQLRLENRTPIF